MNLKIKDLTVKFDASTVIHNLSLNIKEGNLVSFLGPSGCGKSTTLFTIAGLYKQSKGNIYIGDSMIDNIEPEKRNIGMVFQDYALYPHMTVYKNIEFPLRMKKKDLKLAKQKVENIAKLVKIEDLLDRKPSELSGGQQQRVAIARALVKEPKLLLLDEPLSNLDARLRIEMRQEIRRIQKKLNITTIFVTHDQEEALSISDSIVLLNKGIIQQYDNSKNLYENPCNLFVAKFLGNPPINELDGVLNKEMKTISLFKGKLNLSIDNFKKFKNIDSGKYIAAIRGEDFLIYKDKKKDCIDGEVIFVETIGKDTIIKIKVGIKIIKAIIAYDYLDEIPKTIYLSVKEEKIHLFYLNTEENVLS